MTTTVAMEKWEAGQIVRDVLRGDYFQDFTKHDRIHDPDGIYAIEAEMTGRDGQEFFWDEYQREALKTVAAMTPEDRADYLRIELEEEEEEDSE